MKHQKTQAAIQQRRVNELLKQRNDLFRACILLIDANYKQDAGFMDKVNAARIAFDATTAVLSSKFAAFDRSST